MVVGKLREVPIHTTVLKYALTITLPGPDCTLFRVDVYGSSGYAHPTAKVATVGWKRPGLTTRRLIW